MKDERIWQNMEDISLKEIIEVLLKGKWVIVIITVTTLILGGVAYKVLPARYRSTSSILANPITVTAQTDVQNYTDILALPNMDILSYSEQFLNNYTLSKTIEDLDIRDDDGEYVSYESIKNSVTVDNPEKTNILNIQVSHRDPQMAADIANTLSRHFVDYVSSIYQSTAGASASDLGSKLAIEEENLDREAAKLRDYLMNSVSLDVINNEIGSLISQINDYKSSINDFEHGIESNTATLEQLKRAAEPIGIDSLDIPLETLQTGLWTSGSSTGQYTYQLDASDAGTLLKTVLTLKLTDIETELVSDTNKLESLRKKSEELEKRLSDLQALRAQEQYKYNAILRTYNLAESIYGAYNTQYKQALLLETSNIGNINIKVISEAVVPTNAYNRNFVMMEAVAGCLGVFISIFVVLFANYWKTTESSFAASSSRTKAM